jgi:hypothetical protein
MTTHNTLSTPIGLIVFTVMCACLLILAVAIGGMV